MRSRLLLAYACLLMFSGCAVGPDFHSPKASVPPTWTGPAARTTSQPATAPAAEVDLSQWWTSFNDPKLTALVQQAVRSNKDVLLAEARIRQARASRDVAVAALFPTLNGVGSYTRSQAAGVSGGSSSGASGGGSTGTKGAAASSAAAAPVRAPIQNNYQMGLDASWQIDVFGGVRRNIEATEADLRAAEEDRQAVILTLVSEVATSYINLRGFQRQIVIAQENLQIQQHSADLTRQKLHGGLVSQLDVAIADAQVATTASAIPPLEISARQAIYTLGVLLGRQPESLVAELSADAPIPPVPPEVPTGLPSTLLRRRPDIRQAEAQIHAATARVGVATANLFPQFAMTASAGYQSDLLHTLTHSTNGLWSFGPSMDWKLFDGLANLANIEVQKALQEQTALTYEKTILTALQDVENALIAYSKEQEHRKVLQEAVAANRKAVQLSIQSYTQGLTDFLSVLVSQLALYNAENALVQSTTAVSTDLVSLYVALGGGWEAGESSAAASQPASAPAPMQASR